MIRRFLISKYNCDIQLTHTFDDLEKNWKKYHQALIVVSDESDERLIKQLDDFKQQSKAHHHDIPYKILAFKKDNVKQFNSQQVIQIPSDLDKFKHILPSKIKPLSLFHGRRTKSVLKTITSIIYDGLDDDNELTLRQIEEQCQQFTSINIKELDGIADRDGFDRCSLEIRIPAPDPPDTDI